jgi:hypothetical protein
MIFFSFCVCIHGDKTQKSVFSRFLFELIFVIWHFVVEKLVLNDSLFNFKSTGSSLVSTRSTVQEK